VKHEWHFKTKGDGETQIVEGDQVITTIKPGASVKEIRSALQNTVKMHNGCMLETVET
jgi:hypothetical protein